VPNSSSRGPALVMGTLARSWWWPTAHLQVNNAWISYKSVRMGCARFLVSSAGAFSELEAIPTEETMEGPLEPSVSAQGPPADFWRNAA